MSQTYILSNLIFIKQYCYLDNGMKVQNNDTSLTVMTFKDNRVLKTFEPLIST